MKMTPVKQRQTTTEGKQNAVTSSYQTVRIKVMSPASSSSQGMTNNQPSASMILVLIAVCDNRLLASLLRELDIAVAMLETGAMTDLASLASSGLTPVAGFARTCPGLLYKLRKK